MLANTFEEDVADLSRVLGGSSCNVPQGDRFSRNSICKITTIGSNILENPVFL
jgi:hypothetical protein